MFDPIEYQKNRYRERKVRYLNQLGGECNNCGSIEELEFDHVDPEIKSFTITHRISRYSEEVLQKELAKCQLLCTECHLEKTAEESRGRTPWNKGASGSNHGTYSMAYPIDKCDCKLCESYREKRRSSRRTTNNRRPQTRTLVHGTRAGYLKERRRNLNPCDACKKANREYQRKFRG